MSESKTIIVKVTPEQEAALTQCRKLLPGSVILSPGDAVLAVIGLFATQIAKGIVPHVSTKHFKLERGTKDTRKNIALKCSEQDLNRINNIRRAWPGTEIPSVNDVATAVVEAYVKEATAPAK